MERKDQEELLSLLEEQARRERYNQIDYIFPPTGPLRRELYPKHLEFFRKGKTHMQRGVVSANQTGKTTAGCTEDVYHASGEYPDWWEGMTYDRPVTIIIGADRGDTYRDSIQRKLLGQPGDAGSGLIRKSILVDTRPLQGTPGAIGQYFIKHKSGGNSQIVVRTYQAGRTAFEAMVADIVHLDEECPREIYSECATRLATREDGRIYSTFTPDSGLTDTAIYFLDGQDKNNKHVTKITWDDVPHLTEERKAQLLSLYSPHERECRSMGIPFLGSGAIYPIPHSTVFEEPFKIPDRWPKAYALDVGRTMTAAVWGAYDQSNDTWHLYSEHYLGQALPSAHADAIKSRPNGDWIRGVVDPSSHRSEYDGTTLYDQYRKLGLDLQNARNKVTGEDGGIMEVYQRLASGRLKVFDTLHNWRHEYQIYRRDMNGKIVKENDHLMDATRYLMMTGFDVMETEPRDEFESKTYDDDRNPITGY